MDQQILSAPEAIGHVSFGEHIATEVFRSELKQIVRIHQVMFEKFLCDPGEVAPNLADVFQDAGATYLRIAERITALSSSGPA